MTRRLPISSRGRDDRLARLPRANRNRGERRLTQADVLVVGGGPRRHRHRLLSRPRRRRRAPDRAHRDQRAGLGRQFRQHPRPDSRSSRSSSMGDAWTRGFAPTIPLMIASIRLWSGLEAELGADLELSLPRRPDGGRERATAARSGAQGRGRARARAAGRDPVGGRPAAASHPISPPTWSAPRSARSRARPTRRRWRPPSPAPPSGMGARILCGVDAAGAAHRSDRLSRRHQSTARSRPGAW